MPIDASLLVFLKLWTPGQVKTRLAASIGVSRAATLYQGWCRQLLEQLQDLRPRCRMIAHYTGGDWPDFADIHGLVDGAWPQPAGDLGARLQAGFDRASQAVPRVVAIGTDCPTLTATDIDAAVAGLAQTDVVLGPTEDGGYYLIAANGSPAGLFNDIRWSTPSALADQQHRCQQLGLKVTRLSERWDIDTVDDLRRWERESARRAAD